MPSWAIAIIAVVCCLVGVGIGCAVTFLLLKRKKDSAMKQADALLEGAKEKSERLLENAKLEAKAEKEELLRNAEKDISERKKQVLQTENKLDQRENALDKREDAIIQREEFIDQKRNSLEAREESLSAKEKDYQAKVETLDKELERVAGLSMYSAIFPTVSSSRSVPSAKLASMFTTCCSSRGKRSSADDACAMNCSYCWMSVMTVPQTSRQMPSMSLFVLSLSASSMRRRPSWLMNVMVGMARAKRRYNALSRREVSLKGRYVPGECRSNGEICSRRMRSVLIRKSSLSTRDCRERMAAVAREMETRTARTASAVRSAIMVY